MINPLVDITLQVTLEGTPQGVLFGLQKGSGSHYETVEPKMGNGSSIQMTCSIRLKKDQRKI